MDHRLKASIQWALSLVPGGMRVNNRLQAIRKMMPDWFLENKLAVAREMLELHAAHASRPFPPGELRSLEIGAGWDLLLPLAMRGCGAGDIHCIDIYPHLDDRRIADAIALLRRLDAEGCGKLLPSWPFPSVSGRNEALKSTYGITYSAPCDARRTEFDADSFDLFLSYNVMEHIPPQDLDAIHRESFRLLKPGAVAIHHIDLQDHWAYATPRRSVHGFLGDGPLAWKLLNPPIHYQNRLRGVEHLASLRSAGFEIVLQRTQDASAEQLEALRRPGAVHPDFLKRGSLEELAVRNLVVVAKKPG